MKARKFLAIVLALAMILSSMLSVTLTVHAAEYTHIALNLCDLTCSKSFNNGSAHCAHTNTAAAGMSATFGVEPNQGVDNAAVLSATVPENAETLSGVMSMCDNALENVWYNNDNYAEIYGVNAEGETLLATTAVVTADAPLADFNVAVTGYTGIKIKVYNPTNLNTDHITFYNTQFAVPQSSEDAEAAAAVETLIEALPETVAATDKAQINAARAAYDALSTAQKALVENWAVLDAAEAALYEALEYTVIEAESGVCGGTNQGGARVEEKNSASGGKIVGWLGNGNTVTLTMYATQAGERYVQIAYDATMNRTVTITVNGVDTSVNCNEVSGTSFALANTKINLAAGENTIVLGYAKDWSQNIDYIKVEKLTGDSLEPTIGNEDTEAAAAVDALIDTISDPVTAADKAAIEAARTAYDALTTAQKSLVEKLAVLEAAETALYESLEYTVIEAESGVCAGTSEGGPRVSDKDGASGGKIVGYLGKGNTVTLTLYATQAGERYTQIAYNAKLTRNITITVNGVDTSVNCVEVSGASFALANTKINLAAGENTIVLGYANDWAQDVDYIKVEKLAGDSLEKPVVDHDFAVTNSNAPVVANGEKFDITWNANVVLDEGVELAALNGKATFTEYGVIYGTSAEEVTAAAKAGTDTDKAKIKAFAQGDDIDVYTIFGFRLKNVTAGKTRAAQFYVTYELDGMEYTVYSDCVEAVAEIAK